MAESFLVISNCQDSAWLQTLKSSFQPLGQLDITPDHGMLWQIQRQTYSLIIVDAPEVRRDVAQLVGELHQEQPSIPIVVVTTSPTWQRARQIFLAGATDYLRKTLDQEQFLETCCVILKKEP
jgi:DNA-binding NtrC family response regulator